MTLPCAAALLRHRGPARLVERLERVGDHELRCDGRGTGRWRWSQLLEGAAQAAGLVAGLQPGGPTNRAVIAEYRDVAVLATEHVGAVRFTARFERRILHCWRCVVEASAADGRLLLAGRVTVAAGGRR
jgi:hypothetical protein